MTAQFLSGAAMLAAAAIGLFFLRFWCQTRDRFFALLALAFWIFAANRLVLTVLGDGNEASVYVYLARLGAFALILAAIVDKNRSRRARPPSTRSAAVPEAGD